MKAIENVFRFFVGYADLEENEFLYTTDDMYPSSRAPKGFIGAMLCVWAVISIAVLVFLLQNPAARERLEFTSHPFALDCLAATVIATIAGFLGGWIFSLLMAQVNLAVYKRRTGKSTGAPADLFPRLPLIR